MEKTSCKAKTPPGEFKVTISNNPLINNQARAVHRSGRISFGPNPDSTRRRQMEGGGTRNRQLEKLVESVSGEGERCSGQVGCQN